VILVVFLLLNFRSTPPPAQDSALATISDAALISDIEARLDQDLPEALQPAGLLVGEMGGIDSQPTNRNTSHARTRTQQ
jgi:hypothetical protein